MRSSRLAFFPGPGRECCSVVRVGVCMSLFSASPVRSLCPCRFAFSLLKTCMCTLRLTLPTSWRVPCGRRFLCPRSFGARDFVLRHVKKECSWARLFPMGCRIAKGAPTSLLDFTSVNGSALGRALRYRDCQISGSLLPSPLAPSCSAGLSLACFISLCRHFQRSPRSNTCLRSRYPFGLAC